jgi:hypothetical protein
MDVDEFIRHLIAHKDQQALAIKSSSSYIWLHCGDILKSRGHLTLHQQHTDITGMMASLFDINFIGSHFDASKSFQLFTEGRN